MEEDEVVEINLKKLKNLQNAIFTSMELIGDISVTGYTHEKLRKDTQKNLVEAYNTLFAVNKYLSRKTKDKEVD